jgi:ribosomal protein L24E
MSAEYICSGCLAVSSEGYWTDSEDGKAFYVCNYKCEQKARTKLETRPDSVASVRSAKVVDVMARFEEGHYMGPNDLYCLEDARRNGLLNREELDMLDDYLGDW